MNNIIFILFLITILILFYYNQQTINIPINNQQYILQEELEKKINKLNAMLDAQQKQPNLPNLPNPKQQTQTNNMPIIIPPTPDIVNIRDVNVVENPLYPLYGRTERPIIDMLMTNNMFNVRTRGSEDTYHPVGYAKEIGTENIYYLMGRQRYQGSSQGEFYLISTDTTNRLKINLLDRSGNQIIKDIYNVPDKVTINSGIFNGKTFEIEQLKNTDLISPYY